MSNNTMQPLVDYMQQDAEFYAQAGWPQLNCVEYVWRKCIELLPLEARDFKRLYLRFQAGHWDIGDLEEFKALYRRVARAIVEPVRKSLRRPDWALTVSAIFDKLEKEAKNERTLRWRHTKVGHRRDV